VPRQLTVTLCRGCCCGSTTKHPNVNHDAHARRIRDAVRASGTGVTRVVKCLDECEHSDVVLVRRTSPVGRREHFWLGPVNDAVDVDALAQWLSGPPDTPLPDRLQRLRFAKRPPRPPLAARVAAGTETSLICPVSVPDPAAGRA
jgi:hypothetical protein